MYGSPTKQWRALTQHYRSMLDEQLEELAAAFADLTPTAQQALRDEMKLRGLGDPLAPGWTAPRPSSAAAEEAPEARRVEYTWKTPVCPCRNAQEAWLVSEVLKRAGIECWVERPSAYTVHAEFEEASPRVLVAADQLDEARHILEQPIPPDILEESRLGQPVYEIPVCPRCGAPDPVLESADPVNAWLCEVCGAEWSDPADQEA